MICDWITAKGGATGLDLAEVMEIIDSYVLNIPPSGYTFIPTVLQVMGTIDYYLGFTSSGNDKTGCAVVYEDFSTYTHLPSGDTYLSLSPDKYSIQATVMPRTATCYIRKAAAIGHGDFTLDFWFNAAQLTYGTTADTDGGHFGIIFAKNSATTTWGLAKSALDGICLTVCEYTESDGVAHYYMPLKSWTQTTGPTQFEPVLNTIYHVVLTRVGTTVTCKTYNQSGTLLNTMVTTDLSSTTGLNTDIQYFVAMSAAGKTGTYTATGKAYNYILTTTTTAPVLAYSPILYDFGSMTIGQTASTTFDIWNSGTGTLTYSLSESCSWLTVTSSGSSTGEHDTITVNIDTTALSVGTYTCPITITSDGGSGTFTASVTVLQSVVYEDFSTYTHLPSGDTYLSLTPTKYSIKTTNMPLTATSNIRKAAPIGHGDFTLDFLFNATSLTYSTSADTNGGQFSFLFANSASVTDWQKSKTAKDGIILTVCEYTEADGTVHYYMPLQSWTQTTVPTQFQPTLNTSYNVILTRVGTTVTAKIYNASGTLLNTMTTTDLSSTTGLNTDIQYFVAMCGGGVASGTYTATGTAYDFLLSYSQVQTYLFTAIESPSAGGVITGTADGQKTVGTAITVAATASSGYTFVNWSASGITLSNPSNATQSFNMPGNAVTLTANFQGTITGTRLKKFLIIYGGGVTDSTRTNYCINSKFDLIDTSVTGGVSTVASNAQLIKNSVPGCKVIFYEDYMFGATNLTESYYLHTTGGTRIMHGSLPLMNVNHPTSGWSNYFKTMCANRLASYPIFDGVFLDDFNIPCNGAGYDFSPQCTGWDDGYTDTLWKDTWMPASATNLRSGISSSKMLMPNAASGFNGYLQYGTILGAAFWEGFPHGMWRASSDDHMDLSNTVTLINSILAWATAHPTFPLTLHSGVSDPSAESMALYCYAVTCFCAANLDNTYFGWNFYTGSSSNPNYYSWMDTNLGTPVNNYTQISGAAGVYYRTFANYWVIANLNASSTSKTFTGPDGASHTLTGKHALLIAR